ncbi:phage capsid protein [Cellulosimicrobium funkei]|uniref:phage capsid protein n=1 Tax=Cellulosimicrobium funkei TaxID=264251 RepID=UPI003428141C
MAVDNFVPEFWATTVQEPYQNALVFGQPNVANRDYEGTISQSGDTVHVSSVQTPTIKSYDKTQDLEIEDVTTDSTALVIDQGAYFNFQVNDVDAVQAAGNFRDPALSQAGHALRDDADRYIASLFTENVATGGPIAANRLGAVNVLDDEPSKVGAGQAAAYQVLVKLREKFDDQSVPLEGRYVVVSPAFVSALLMDKRYTDLSASGSTDALLNGQVGRGAGFEVLVSGNLPKSGGATTICAGVPGALSFADQITKVEAGRLEKRFADYVRGLNIYGSKIFRRNGVATAEVTIVGGGFGS